MLDLTPPDGWLTAFEWHGFDAVSYDAVYRLHIAEERADPGLLEAVQNDIIEELEAHYGIEFECNDDNEFRRVQ